MKLATLETPAALVDEACLQRNIARMQRQVSGLGPRLRPHVKTTKCVAVAEQQRAAGGTGITVSTLREAEAFFDAGFDDILYAVGIVPAKLPAVKALRARGCRLIVVLDSLAAAQAVVQAGPGLEVMIEIDTDGHRAGIVPDAPLLLDVARTLHNGGAVLVGVMTHAGASYDCRTPEALQAMAEQERSRCVAAAERIRTAGIPCPEVSVGSTPTALSARHLAGVTEVRAGVYAFNDLVMHGVGVCGLGDIALSVLTTVIGHHGTWMLVDAGWMAMSRDRGTAGHALDFGYGAVCDEAGQPIEGLVMGSANQEHGLISWREGFDGGSLERRFPLGTRLRVLPNHACATAAQFQHYEVLKADGSIARWPRFNGW